MEISINGGNAVDMTNSQFAIGQSEMRNILNKQ